MSVKSLNHGCARAPELDSGTISYRYFHLTLSPQSKGGRRGNIEDRS